MTATPVPESARRRRAATLIPAFPPPTTTISWCSSCRFPGAVRAGAGSAASGVRMLMPERMPLDTFICKATLDSEVINPDLALRPATETSGLEAERPGRDPEQDGHPGGEDRELPASRRDRDAVPGDLPHRVDERRERPVRE